MPTTDPVREDRLRRRARRLGLYVTKSRQLRYGYGPYFVIEPDRNLLVSSEYGMDLDELETFLAED